MDSIKGLTTFRRSGLIPALFSILVLILQVIPGSFVQAEEQYPQATGLNEPTQAQAQWMNDNFPVIQKIRLNALALQRTNAERVARGLRSLSNADFSLAPMGQEAIFSNYQAVPGELSETSTLQADALPISVDNSSSPAFPPIRSQGSIGSCACWATAYYQLTYETNLARGLTASAGDNSVIFSPKWSYDMINGGGDNGSSFSEAYALELKNGAANWADFPYDTDYLAWSMNPSAWNQALNSRPLSWGRISNSDVAALIDDVKTELANGHVIVIGTYVTSWVQSAVSNDPSTTQDDAYTNQKIASYMRNTDQGGHGMTIVGYNDSLWCDLNGNGVADSGEKGALKIANSWGTHDWNNGYRWVSYDALQPTSAAPSSGTWPTADRSSSGIFWSGNLYTLTASPAYTPTMKAKVTLNHARRGQLSISLGIGDVGATKPATTWNSKAVYNSGGNYAFNGTTTAIDGTFYFDFTDLAKSVSGNKRWFVGVNDKTAGDPATIKSFDLYQATPSGDVLVASASGLPKTADASQVYASVDYSYSPVNLPPSARIVASTTGGNVPLSVNFDGTSSTDPDGTVASYTWTFGDTSSGSGPTVSHTYGSSGQFTAALKVTDNSGATSSTSVVINAISPTLLVVSGYASPAISLDSHNFTVAAQKASGQAVTDYIGTIRFTSSDSQAILPGNYTFIPSDNGSHIFNATLKTPGNQSISAIDTVTANVTGSQSGILVNYSLHTAAAGSGTVAKNPDLSSYSAGAPVSLTAAPSPGWTFTGWSGSLSGSTNPASIIMNANKTVTANFAQNPDEYTLTLNFSGQGSVGQYPQKPIYDTGDAVQLTATPASGWSFSGWSGDLTGSANPATVAMNNNKNVTATFSQNAYTLTVNVSGSGTVGRDNDGPYHLNDIVHLTAMPAAGWSFSSWSGAAGGSVNAISLTLAGNTILNASFVQNQYALGLTIVGSGGVVKNPNQASYASNSSVQLTASVASGWTFSGWSGDLTGNANPASITMNANKTVTATFTQNPVQYSLNVNIAGSGSVVKNPNQANYASNSSVQLTASAASGWTFSGWSGDLTGNANPVSITINANKTVTATFTQNLTQYSLNVNVAGSGSVVKNPNQASYASNSSVQLTASAASGWTFSGWSGDLTGNANPCTAMLDRNKTVTASFVLVGGGGGGGGGTGGGGGGFSGGGAMSAAPAPIPGHTDIGEKSGADGVFYVKTYANSSDDRATVSIDASTKGLTSTGTKVTHLTVIPVAAPPDPPADNQTVILCYEFGPSGATFDRPIQISLKYDPSLLPEGTDPGKLYIAWWDSNHGAWIVLDSSVDTVNHNITAHVNHFTQFAALVPETLAPMSLPSLPPGPVLEPVPAAIPSTTPTVPTGSPVLSDIPPPTHQPVLTPSTPFAESQTPPQVLSPMETEKTTPEATVASPPRTSPTSSTPLIVGLAFGAALVLALAVLLIVVIKPR
jgi:uncharacterized repeat protein (TIGR02543 family)